MGNGLHCGVKVNLFLIILRQITACNELYMQKQSNIWKICHSLLRFLPWRLTCHNIFATDAIVLKSFIKVRKQITCMEKKDHNKLWEDILREWVFKLGKQINFSDFHFYQVARGGQNPVLNLLPLMTIVRNCVDPVCYLYMNFHQGPLNPRLGLVWSNDQLTRHHQTHGYLKYWYIWV